MALYTFFIFSFSWYAVLNEGFGFPMINQSAGNVPHRQRTKRCACINQLDSECHYFCHLDIIWVNTPSKTTVYGLGSPLARRRRSTGRCLCASPADHTCYIFCIHSTKDNADLPKSASEPLHAGSDLNSDLNIAQGSLPNAESGIDITKGSMDTAQVEFLTFLRNLMRAKSRAMKMAGAAKQQSLMADRPGPS